MITDIYRQIKLICDRNHRIPVPPGVLWYSSHYMRPAAILADVHQYILFHNDGILWSRLAMAKNNNFSTNMEFINATLNAEQDEQFVQWYQHKDGRAAKAILTAFGDDYRIAVTLDAGNNTFIASMTTKNEKGVNRGKCLTARSDEWLEAVAMVVFKHDVLFKADEWVETTKRPIRG